MTAQVYPFDTVESERQRNEGNALFGIIPCVEDTIAKVKRKTLAE